MLETLRHVRILQRLGVSNISLTVRADCDVNILIPIMRITTPCTSATPKNWRQEARGRYSPTNAQIQV